MTEPRHFDCVVIGGGSGLTAAYYALQDKKSVALITDQPDAIGGTCINFGCIPTKTLIASAHAIQAINNAERFGIYVDTATPAVDFPRIMRNMRGSRADNAQAVRQWVEQTMTPFYSRVRFVGDKLLETNDGMLISGDKLFIASGARAVIPPIEGLEAAGYWTNDDVLELDEQPTSLVIIGGGYIGAELGYFFAALGTDVTVVNPHARLLREDDEVRDLFTREFARHAQLVIGRAVRASASGDHKAVDIESENGEVHTVEAEQILVATGRRPNTEPLELAATGVQLTGHGAIQVDEHLRTEHPNTYAYGDVIGQGQFKHTSSAEGELAWRNSQGADQRMSYRSNPHAVFSDPEVAAVGLTEAECRAQSLDYRVARLDYADVAKGKIIGSPTGLAKLLVENGSEQILGCHIVGPDAALPIHEVVTAMNTEGARANLVRDSIHIHPSPSELIGALFDNV